MQSNSQVFNYNLLHSLNPNIQSFSNSHNNFSHASPDKRYVIYNKNGYNLVKHLYTNKKLPKIYNSTNNILQEFQKYKSFKSLSEINPLRKTNSFVDINKKITNKTRNRINFYPNKSNLINEKIYNFNSNSNNTTRYANFAQKMSRNNSCDNLYNNSKNNFNTTIFTPFSTRNRNQPLSPITKINTISDNNLNVSSYNFYNNIINGNLENENDVKQKFFSTTYSSYGLGKNRNIKGIKEEDMKEKECKLTKVNNDENIFYRTIFLPKDKYVVPVLVYSQQKMEDEENKHFYEKENYNNFHNDREPVKKKKNYCQENTQRRVRRKQIFDNCRPFLCDDFKDFYDKVGINK